MKILMTKTMLGSIDGIHVDKYSADVEYDIPEKLADVFLKIKSAIRVEEKAVDAPPENKAFIPPKGAKNKAFIPPKGAKNKAVEEEEEEEKEEEELSDKGKVKK